MATFALVHGAWFGEWCWAPLAVRLRRMGHTVATPDLPIDDVDAGIAEYAAAIEKSLDEVEAGSSNSGGPNSGGSDSGGPNSGGPNSGGPDSGSDVILVGHDLGGLTIPVVAEHRPVAGLIFMCAFLPDPGKPMQVDPDTFSPAWAALSAKQVTDDDGRTSWPVDVAIQAFFHDCPYDLAAASARQLRPQAWTPANQDNPLQALPTAPAAYVLCSDDRSIDPAWSRRVARSRLGVDPIELPGGHSPMLVDPDLIADLLDQMAAGLAQIR
jgi:pimeloyl-ACP methyl ester carboxylesterase